MARHRILENRELGADTYVLRIQRQNLDFEPGQYIHVGLPSGIHRREYSIYSSPADDYLEILVKEIIRGQVSSQLRCLKKGDAIDLEGPFGYFRIDMADLLANFLFIATGTGISPFHCMMKFYPELDYRLLHGIRTLNERYDYSDYEAGKLVSCVSREEGGSYHGRVTGWLKDNPISESTMAYLCGNGEMIDEVYEILGSQGLSADRIHAELYY